MSVGLEYGPPSLEKTLGALPVVRDFLARLDVAGTVDRLCPVRDLARLTHGQVIEALIANRLTSPTPLVRVTDWAQTWAVQEMLGIPADALGGDRIGRAPDALAPEAEHVAGSVGTRAIVEFGVDVSRIHWDMTVRHEALVRREALRIEGGARPPRWAVAAVRWELSAV